MIMSHPPHKIALVFPRPYEYSHRIAVGIAQYKQDHPDLQIRDFGIQQEDMTPAHLEAWRPDGVICFLGLRSQPALDLLLGMHRPVINISSDFTPEKVYTVHADPDAIAATAIEHFRESDLSSTAYADVEHRPGSDQRRAAFARHALADGCTFTHLMLPDDTADDPEVLSRRPHLIEQMRRLPRGTGILCLDDIIGDALCRAAARLKRHIPDDLSVLGVNDSDRCAFVDPPLTSIRVPAEKIGREAIAMLHGLLRDQLPACRVRRVACEGIAVRRSTRVMPRASDVIDLRRIHKLIEERACSGLRVDDLVETLPCSRVTFEKRFKDATGTTPGAAIRAAKLGRAQRLLAETDLTSTRIALMCGFEGLSNFCNIFRKAHGQTPSAYRKRRRPKRSSD